MAKEIIITGCPRTGTTALCSLLYHSSRVLITNELALYHPDKEAPRKRMRLPLDSHVKRALELKNWSIERLEDFRQGNLSDSTIDVFGDKNPDYCLNPAMINYFTTNQPCDYYIFTHRNPCAIVASFLRRSAREKDVQATWYSQTAEEAANKAVEYTRNWTTYFYPKVDKKKIVIYEDHCEDVNNLIQELNEFLGITLDIHKPERLYYPVNINTWQDYLSPADIDMVKRKFEPIDQLVRSLAQDES